MKISQSTKTGLMFMSVVLLLASFCIFYAIIPKYYGFPDWIRYLCLCVSQPSGWVVETLFSDSRVIVQFLASLVITLMLWFGVGYFIGTRKEP